MYCLNLLGIALELAVDDPAYEDVASKFFEHFVYIAHAMHHMGEDGFNLWDEEDGFFYDVIRRPDGSHAPIRIRSVVGLIPLSAVVTGDSKLLDRFPGFKRRMQWFAANRPDLIGSCASMSRRGGSTRVLFSSSRRTSSAACCGSCSTRKNFCRPTASGRFPSTTATTPTRPTRGASSTG